MTIHIGAITLAVKNLTTVAAFYRDAVGLAVLVRSRGECVLGTDARPLVVLKEKRAGQARPGHPGLYHLALRLPSRVALAHWLAHYTNLGCPLWQGASDHGVSEAIYLSDPEGNGIEITSDSPRSQWVVAPDGRITVFARQLDVDDLLACSPPRPWRGLPDCTDMGHIHLRVADIAQAKGFYVNGLGFGLKTELPDSALFVAAGDYHHHIGLNVWQSQGALPAPWDSLGLASFDIHFGDPTILAQTAERLTQAGYTVQPHKESTGLAQYQVVDPFGIQMLLKSDISTP